MRNNKVEQTHQEVKAYVGHNSIIFQTWRIDVNMWSTSNYQYQIVTSANPRATLNFSIWLILVKTLILYTKR